MGNFSRIEAVRYLRGVPCVNSLTGSMMTAGVATDSRPRIAPHGRGRSHSQGMLERYRLQGDRFDAHTCTCWIDISGGSNTGLALIEGLMSLIFRGSIVPGISGGGHLNLAFVSSR